MFAYIALPVLGFLIGLFIITLDGGGAIYVGIFTGFFNISPAIAASTSLATMIPTTAVGTAARRYRVESSRAASYLDNKRCIYRSMLLKRIHKNKLKKARKPILFCMTLGMGILVALK